MPIPESVRDFLADLLGRAVEVDKRRAPRNPNDPDGVAQWTVTYLDDKGHVAGACVSDLSLAAAGGSALAMMPPSAAEEAIRAGDLPEGLAENWAEVANVLSRLLNGPCTTHLRMGEGGAGVPDSVAGLMQTSTASRHFDVSVIGYPNGAMSFYAN